ncbi:MAG: HAMP domain-containing histidine kinase [Pseudomonadota bacterium]|nr:HAMP domain-containing histidine kinase [Pseudomonadota bacterium]
MPRTHLINEQLDALADTLEQRSEAILQAWRATADGDSRLTTGISLPQSQFNDHIPHVLQSFGRKLRAWPNDVSEMDKEANKDATTHGLQRWHQGYRLREVTREWGHLQLVVHDELEQYAMGQPAGFDAMSIARRTWIELCAAGVSESTSEYFRLEQLEASGHVRDLAQTLKDERALEQERSELWRQAAHDLRGHIGTVVNATTGLASPEAAAPVRDRFLVLLQRSTGSLHSMLDDVMGLARLQAGQERLEIKEFDAARLLSELCDALQAQAEERGLYLKAGGLPTLVVQGDPVKLRRIAQNLLLNALKYTVVGGVTVSWGDSRENDPVRWAFFVRDTGPGFHNGPGAPLLAALKEATAAAHDMDREAGVDPESLDPDGATDSDPRAVKQARGEGIGLSIVKRLGDLLNATIELESNPEIGTSFRVALPRRYQPSAVSAAEQP